MWTFYERASEMKGFANRTLLTLVNLRGLFMNFTKKDREEVTCGPPTHTLEALMDLDECCCVICVCI